MRVGMGEVAAVKPEARAVFSTRRLLGPGHIDGGRHEGRRLYAGDMKRGFRIREVRADSFILAGEPAEIGAAFHSAEKNHEDNRYWISDIGPGDWVRAPSVIRRDPKP
jgi:hypothetical protein